MSNRRIQVHVDCPQMKLVFWDYGYGYKKGWNLIFLCLSILVFVAEERHLCMDLPTVDLFEQVDGMGARQRY